MLIEHVYKDKDDDILTSPSNLRPSSENFQSFLNLGEGWLKKCKDNSNEINLLVSHSLSKENMSLRDIN